MSNRKDFIYLQLFKEIREIMGVLADKVGAARSDLRWDDLQEIDRLLALLELGSDDDLDELRRELKETR